MCLEQQPCFAGRLVNLTICFVSKRFLWYLHPVFRSFICVCLRILKLQFLIFLALVRPSVQKSRVYCLIRSKMTADYAHWKLRVCVKQLVMVPIDTIYLSRLMHLHMAVQTQPRTFSLRTCTTSYILKQIALLFQQKTSVLMGRLSPDKANLGGRFGHCSCHSVNRKRMLA